MAQLRMCGLRGCNLHLGRSREVKRAGYERHQVDQQELVASDSIGVDIGGNAYRVKKSEEE